MCVFALQGTTVENICSELRYLPVTQALAEERPLLILCDLSYSNNDAVEVAMVIVTHRHRVQSFSLSRTSIRFWVVVVVEHLPMKTIRHNLTTYDIRKREKLRFELAAIANCCS